MAETEFRGTARKTSVANRWMQLRRCVMFGCLGLLFLMAASGFSPLDVVQGAWGVFGGAQGQPEGLTALDAANLFRPFGQRVWQQSPWQPDVQRKFSETVPATSRWAAEPVQEPSCPGEWARSAGWANPSECACNVKAVHSANRGDDEGTACIIHGGYGTTPRCHQALSKALEAPYILGRLQAVGVEQYRLEPWGPDGQVYRFWCRVPLGESAPVARHFESIDRDSGEAVARVLAQIEAWRRGG